MPDRRRNRLTIASGVVALVVTALVASASTGIHAAEPEIPLPSADAVGSAAAAILAEAWNPDEPGGAAIVVRKGEVLFRGSRGVAELEHGISLDPSHVFRLGSITKQFTAAAVMLLVEDGKLALDDPLTKFLPDYPVGERVVTVEHLLNHTSGIRSYTGIPGWMTTKIKADMELDDLIAAFQDEPWDFDPGERWSYNNSGYVILGAVIEKASGVDYETFIEERIFGPLGMEHSDYGDHERLIPKRVRGYTGQDGVFENAPYLSMTQPHAAGSLLSTVDDLVKWNTGLVAGKVVSGASLEKMWTPTTPADGSDPRYGYGFQLGSLRGRDTIHHGGGIHGFATHAVYLPDDEVYVAVLSNHPFNRASPQYLTTKLAAVAIGEPYPVPTTVAVPEETLAKYAGVYRIDEGTTRTVTVEDGRLYTRRGAGPRNEARPTESGAFAYEHSLACFRFMTDDAGDVTAMEMEQRCEGNVEIAERTEAPIPPVRPRIEVAGEILDRYVGTYRIAPEFAIEVRREGAGLVTQATGQQAFPIFAESETKFFLEVVDAEIEFVLDEAGAVTHAFVSQNGAKMRGNRED